MNKPRILLLDIETINLKANLSPVLSFAWKVYGHGETKCLGLWDYPTWKKSPFNDRPLCRDILKIIRGADALVGHFATGFDFKFLKTRFLYHKLGTFPPCVLLDTWKIARDHLLLTGNRLANIAKFLRVKTQKGDSGGWQTWLDVVNKNPAAIRKMVKYNKQDVACLEAVFSRLIPYVSKMPSYAIFAGDVRCPSCGDTRLKNNGKRADRLGGYRRLVCTGCGSWSKLRTLASGKTSITGMFSQGSSMGNR